MNPDCTEPLPPPAICSERVLHYAMLDETVSFNSAHRSAVKIFGDKELGKAPCLAICERKDDSGVVTYYCDGDWQFIGVSAHDSVDAAKRRAEYIYPGSAAKWIEAHFTEEDVSRHLEEIWGDHRCSFCGKRPDQDIESIIETQDGKARICDKCIAEFSRKLPK